MIASVPKLARSELSSQCQNAAHSSSSGFNLLILDITFRNIDLGLPDEAAVGVDRRGAAADEAAARAEQLRPIFEELSGLSARRAADELNRRCIPTATGGKWHATQVIRVRERL